jgi:hypothetical protein
MFSCVRACAWAEGGTGGRLLPREPEASGACEPGGSHLFSQMLAAYANCPSASASAVYTNLGAAALAEADGQGAVIAVPAQQVPHLPPYAPPPLRDVHATCGACACASHTLAASLSKPLVCACVRACSPSLCACICVRMRARARVRERACRLVVDLDEGNLHAALPAVAP